LTILDSIAISIVQSSWNIYSLICYIFVIIFVLLFLKIIGVIYNSDKSEKFALNSAIRVEKPLIWAIESIPTMPEDLRIPRKKTDIRKKNF